MATFRVTKRRYTRRLTIVTLKISLGIFFLLFVIPPVLFKYSYRLQRSIIFPANVDPLQNFSNPLLYGIHGARNFYVDSGMDVKLGVWQILPEKHPFNASSTEIYFEKALNNGQNIVIYYHGNAGNRATAYRIALYKILRNQFHVIAFDYRGYGDSTPASPTEYDVVRDCVAIYKWVVNKSQSKIFVWGHSLGSSLAIHMLSLLRTENIRATGLILESPFTNMRDEIKEHAFAQPFRALPWFHYTIVEPMEQNSFIFGSDMYILNVDCTILILHAEDDRVVPVKLGSKLYKIALQHRRPRQGSIGFTQFPAIFGYGHRYIHKAPELSDIIASFVSKAITEMDNMTY